MIYVIGGSNMNTYYALDDGKIYNGSTGSVYIEDFIDEMKIEHTYLEIHPDIIYGDNGCHCGLSNIHFSTDFKSVNDIPKWFYCYNSEEPLLKQLTEEEFDEFVSIDNQPYLVWETQEKGVKTFTKDWYVENGYR